MATDPDFIAYVHEQAALGERLADRRMFGEYALYLDGKLVALACDNSLWLKPTGAGQALLPRLACGAPYPGAKPHYLLDEFLDDADLLAGVLQATADALPPPRPKRPKPARRVLAEDSGPGRASARPVAGGNGRGRRG